MQSSFIEDDNEDEYYHFETKREDIPSFITFTILNMGYPSQSPSKEIDDHCDIPKEEKIQPLPEPVFSHLPLTHSPPRIIQELLPEKEQVTPKRTVSSATALSPRQFRSYKSKDEDCWKARERPGKIVCHSCRSRKTCRWHTTFTLGKRDPFVICNACFIRMKKYQQLCYYCHYAVTKKQADSGICPRCERVFINKIDKLKSHE